MAYKKCLTFEISFTVSTVLCCITAYHCNTFVYELVDVCSAAHSFRIFAVKKYEDEQSVCFGIRDAYANERGGASSRGITQQRDTKQNRCFKSLES